MVIAARFFLGPSWMHDCMTDGCIQFCWVGAARPMVWADTHVAHTRTSKAGARGDLYKSTRTYKLKQCTCILHYYSPCRQEARQAARPDWEHTQLSSGAWTPTVDRLVIVPKRHMMDRPRAASSHSPIDSNRVWGVERKGVQLTVYIDSLMDKKRHVVIDVVIDFDFDLSEGSRCALLVLLRSRATETPNAERTRARESSKIEIDQTTSGSPSNA